jgi:hypothetical protein
MATPMDTQSVRDAIVGVTEQITEPVVSEIARDPLE